MTAATALHLPMTGDLGSATPTPEPELERAVQTVREHAQAFARLPIAQKIDLLRAVQAGMHRVAPAWVRAACHAKGLPPDGPLSGEEWLAGPVITVRNLRLLIAALQAVARAGRPPLGTGTRQLPDGRLAVRVFPSDARDGVLFAGFRCETHLLPGIDEAGARARQAEFYQQRDPPGRVAVILGAGNVASIPPLDTIYKMFVEGYTAVLKMNPVNDYLGPFFVEAMAPLLQAGYLRIVYGGADTGRFLVEHPAVDHVHITGSDLTHDLIVWGPPGAERERRKREGDPLLKKSITSELGNVSPIVIVPGDYTSEQLWFQARNVASMVGNNASFNCNAGKVLVTSRGWKQRETFLMLVRKALGEMPLRRAYYPGAAARYETLLSGRDRVERFGNPQGDQLPWALVPDLDPEDREEQLFQVEPFCGILSETALPETDPAGFLAAATRFCNERLWGTLNACLVVPPRLEQGSVGQQLERSIAELRYGSVAINHWPALVYGTVTPPWGGHPSATLQDIQSGLGWVHNTFLLGGIEKNVMRGPIVVRPRPPWFYDHQRAHEIGRRLVGLEASASWLQLPGIVLQALRG
ncbi:MAG: aldehyde dehydrogenase family protein [Myxococcales bacterium]|nr:aldehyde dehydrogenase family protein [Myxococcota bacterium]MDW8282088.1 aldehyde dehydrogenase family protein [Myxococcales bacterium]